MHCLNIYNRCIGSVGISYVLRIKRSVSTATKSQLRLCNGNILDEAMFLQQFVSAERSSAVAPIGGIQR